MTMEPVSQSRQSCKEWGIRLLLMSISLLVALGMAEVIVRIFFPIWDGRDNVTLDGKPIDSWFEPGECVSAGVKRV